MKINQKKNAAIAVGILLLFGSATLTAAEKSRSQKRDRERSQIVQSQPLQNGQASAKQARQRGGRDDSGQIAKANGQKAQARNGTCPDGGKNFRKGGGNRADNTGYRRQEAGGGGKRRGGRN